MQPVKFTVQIALRNQKSISLVTSPGERGSNIMRIRVKVRLKVIRYANNSHSSTQMASEEQHNIKSTNQVGSQMLFQWCLVMSPLLLCYPVQWALCTLKIHKHMIGQKSAQFCEDFVTLLRKKYHKQIHPCSKSKKAKKEKSSYQGCHNFPWLRQKFFLISSHNNR